MAKGIEPDALPVPAAHVRRSAGRLLCVQREAAGGKIRKRIAAFIVCRRFPLGNARAEKAKLHDRPRDRLT